MGVGLVVGREKVEDFDQYLKAMKVANQVYTRFRDKIGHSICAEIHKIRYGRVYRLIDPVEQKAFHDMGGHSRTGCAEVVGVAARIAAELILDQERGS